ncbi:MAG: uroporphyrinogen decarboxylase family protein [Acutalibacteraceae bacterium]
MNELLYKAITYNYPETIPVSVGIQPAAWIRHRGELQRLLLDYPQFFPNPTFDENKIPMSEQYRAGTHIDEWGCVWENIEEGMDSMVKGHPIKSADDIFSLEIPKNRDGRLPHGFMYLRLLDLCGFEDAMIYFAEEGEEIKTLISKVLEYNCRQIEAILPNIDRMVSFGDDLGMQNGLAVGPERWRRLLGPCYAKMYSIIKRHNPETLIYMHTDGCIWEIMNDLKQCGVDMINPQFRANGLSNLVRVCKGKIPINLDLDRQLFPFGTRSELMDHVGECVEALYLPEGGLGLYAEFNRDIPLENMAAVLDGLEKYRHYK